MFKNKDLIIEKMKLLTDTRVIGLIAFGFVALLVTWSGVKVVQTNYELDKKIAVAKQRNEIAKLENENLKLKNKYYESNQYLELASRRQFGKAAPGELLYIVPKEVALSKTADKPVTSADETPLQRHKSKFRINLELWQNFLFR